MTIPPPSTTDHPPGVGGVVLVTGGARGIGARVVRRLAREGYAVVASYLADERAAHDVEAALVAANGRGALRRSDVSDPAAVRALFDYAESAFGPVRAVVHNAGVQGPEGVPLAETSEADFDRVFGVNVRGTFLVLREAARRVADGGRIVTLSSSVTAMPMPTYGPYAASKSAVETLTAVLARELGARGVRVNCVAPGPTDTDLFLRGKSPELVRRIGSLSPLGRIAAPDEIAAVISFLLGADGGWVSGQTLHVNGGMT